MRAFHPEDKARSAIDARFVACGWLVQSRDEMNLSAGTGVAVREFATASGPVDYALFVDKRFCGAVEAKPAGTTLSGFSEQAARYIADAPDFLGGDARQRRCLDAGGRQAGRHRRLSGG
jgi:type I restriction enzyme R subunit